MTEQTGNMPPANRLPDGIPKVSPEMITAFLAEPRNFDTLFDALKDSDRQLANYILQRARELAPTDLDDRERVAQLALEVLGIVNSQAQARIFDALFDGIEGVEPDSKL